MMGLLDSFRESKLGITAKVIGADLLDDGGTLVRLSLTDGTNYDEYSFPVEPGEDLTERVTAEAEVYKQRWAAPVAEAILVGTVIQV